MKKAIARTIVKIPIENKQPPFDVALVADETGRIQWGTPPSEAVKCTLGIIGVGTIGSSLAVHAASKGLNVIALTTHSPEQKREKLMQWTHNRYPPAVAASIGPRIKLTKDYADMRTCDIVIECAVENLQVKQKVFRQLEKATDAVLATNSSSLSLKKIFETVDQSRVCGFHLFNPVDRMQLVEISFPFAVPSPVKTQVMNLAQWLDKKPVFVADSPGFIVNRLLFAQLNQAIMLHEKNIASKEDIDLAMKLGLNHPMGPFRLMDLIGLDVTLEIFKSFHEQTGEALFRPAPSLIQKVADGQLGRKTRKGYYEY